MHGPLICHDCRIFLKDDAAHEKEQQAYEDRKQAKYAAQLAGTNTETNTDNKEITTEDATTEDKAPDDAHTTAVARPPSPPHDLPQHYTRITLAQVFLLGLQDRNVLKFERKDGRALTPRSQPIPLHLNRFASLTEIQDHTGPTLDASYHPISHGLSQAKTNNKKQHFSHWDLTPYPTNTTG